MRTPGATTEASFIVRVGETELALDSDIAREILVKRSPEPAHAHAREAISFAKNAQHSAIAVHHECGSSPMMPDQDADSDSSGAAATFSTLNSIAGYAQ